MKLLGFIVLFTALVTATWWAYARVTEAELAVRNRERQTEVFEVPEHMQAAVVRFLGEPVFK